MLDRIKGALIGLAVGDALGVPVEFKSREHLKTYPVMGMQGFGSWSQPAGTWSDDSSLAFCLAESLTVKYDIDDIAKNFTCWLQEGFWGAHYTVFDVGGATRYAIARLIKGVPPQLSGGMMEKDNGNGSLMRIMPLLFHIKDMPIQERYQKIKEVSSITHAHFRSVFSCFIYLEMALNILRGKTLGESYAAMQQVVLTYVDKEAFNKEEVKLFDRLLNSNIGLLGEADIASSGYVLDTLEASFWCLLNSSSYATAVLPAVNLGRDTDTTGCVTGGLAGLFYGYEKINKEWVNTLARRADIENLCKRLKHD